MPDGPFGPAPTLSEAQEALRPLSVQDGGRRLAGEGPVITCCIATLNCGAALLPTLDAIDAQGWPDTEVVLADGGSAPETQEVIRAAAPRLTRWLSAPDGGISDGFNRAVALAQGDLIQITNSGDRLAPGYFAAALAAPKAGFSYGDVLMVDEKGRETRRLAGVPRFWRRPFDSMAVAPHPALIARRETFATAGLFNPNIRLAMDFDWIARVLAAGFEGAYTPDQVAVMEEGGASNRNAAARDRENLRITAHYNLMPSPQRELRHTARQALNLTLAALDRLGPPGAALRNRLKSAAARAAR